MGEYADYYRIREKVQANREAIHRSLQRGYGTKHPEKIHGYAGFFFDTGDVFISEGIAQFWEDEDLRLCVFASLGRFEKGDWGEISSGDIDVNIENRYLFGGDTFGRYGYYYEDNGRGKERFDEVIKIRTWKGNTWISYDSEPDRFMLAGEQKVYPEIDERPEEE